jgi:hypothetical protein
MIRIISGTLAVILTVITIIASAGYIVNESNMVENKQIKSSVEFKSLEDAKINQKDLYTVKKNEIERLQAMQEKIKTEGNQAVNSLPRDYITAKQNQRDKTSRQVDTIQSQINTIQSELSNISNNISKPIDVKNIKFKNENGYISLFEMIASGLNKTESFKESPVSTNDLMIYFFIFISAIFQLVAVWLYVIEKKVISIVAFVISFAFTFCLMTSMTMGIVSYILAGGMAFVLDASSVMLMHIAFFGIDLKFIPSTLSTKTNLKSKLDNLKSFKLPKRSDSPITARKIGFDIENKKNPNIIKFDKVSDFNDGDLKKYIEYMNATAIDGISQGYCKIAKNIGIPVNKANKIKGYLEQKNIIKTIGGKTEILKNI